MRSRALQAFTTYYWRACGTTTGTFQTANIALGNTYNEAFPADPAVGTRPYFAAAGSYAWPEFMNWDRTNPAARPETVIDPQTGMLLKRLALPQDQPISYSEADSAGLAFTDSIGTAWTAPANTLTDDAAAATYSGTVSDMLFVTRAPFGSVTLSDMTFPTEWLQLSMKAWCSGGTCSGENAKVQACLSLDGVTCWPTNATAKFQEVALGTTALPGTYLTLGSAVPLIDSWTPSGYAALSRSDLATRRGLTDVDAGGVAVWKAGGSPNTYFSANWGIGAKITIGASMCAITARSGVTQVTIVPASCVPALSVPVTDAAFTGPGFGFLVRKKTATTDQINIQHAKLITGASQYMDYTASGSAKLCSDTLTLNTVTGGLGYHCVMMSGYPLLYWVDHVTGDANYLGLFSIPSQSGVDGWAGGVGGGSFVGTTPEAPEHFYTSAAGNGGKTVLLSCTLTSTNQPGNQSIACTNLTPESTGKDVNALAAAFTAGDTPAFDTAVFGLSAQGQQGTKILLGDTRGSQDSVGWTAMFDPDKVDTVPGCVGGGAAGCVVAAQSTWGNAPVRWCVNHTRFNAGASDLVWVAGKYLSDQGTPGDGPYTSVVASAATQLPLTPSIAPGVGACPAGSAGCDVVTTDGEPCDTSPRGGENAGAYVCPKNSAYAFLQNSAVGDIFNVEGEVVKMVAKASATSWTVQRAYINSPISHSNGAVASASCTAYDWASNGGASTWDWTWDTVASPHGLDINGAVKLTYSYDHVTPRTDATLGDIPWYDPNCSHCYGVRDGVGSMGDAPNRFVTYKTTFAGAAGTAAYPERAQPHASRLQDTAIASEKKWFTDGRPLKPLMDISDAATLISGQLYRMTSTTPDGDNMSRVGDNTYVRKTGATTLVAAGNCSVGSPCSLWADTTLIENLTTPCAVTLNSGTGTVYISRISAGGLGVTYTSGLSVSTDACPTALGTGYPAGATQLWTWGATAGTWATSGTDTRANASGYFGIINRKQTPTWAYCGSQALIDASSATTGNVLGDTSSDAYKYCVARKAGECRAASTPGDIYANCPNMVKRVSGSYGCSWNSPNNEVGVDLCFGNMNGYLNSVVQIGFAATDLTGALGRSLTKGLGRYKLMDDYFHGKSLSDASWVMFRSLYVGGSWANILLGKLPPFPAPDGVDRTTFIRAPISITTPQGQGIAAAAVEFGYAEQGLPTDRFCTSRREICLVVASTVVDATPFYFKATDSYTRASCATSCTITLPVLPGHIAFFTVKFYDGSGAFVQNGVSGVALESVVKTN